MYRIYLLKDINGFEYVGRTKQTFTDRLSKHRYKKKIGDYLSSHKLDLYNCEMILLEECDDSLAPEREQYWMDQYPNRVNSNNAIITEDRRTDRYKKANKKRCKYQNSWGGRIDKNNNSLLKIDPNLFSQIEL